jgi:hypothetical protein
MKAIPQQEFQNVSNNGNIIEPSAQLLKGNILKVTLSVSPKYTVMLAIK